MQERSRQFEPMQFTGVETVTVDIEGAGSVRLRVSGAPDGFYARVLVGWPEVPEYVTDFDWETVGEPTHSIFLDIHLSDVRKAPDVAEWLLTSSVLQDVASAARELRDATRVCRARREGDV